MFKIRASLITEYQAQMDLGFEEKLRAAFGKKYCHILPRFPEPVQMSIVRNLVARAKGWGISSQASVVAFSELMLALAPNFDEQPDLRSALAGANGDIDHVMLSLAKIVPRESWTAARAEAQDLPLFVLPDSAAKPMVEQTASAIRLVLWDLPPTHNPKDLASQAAGLAAALGLDAIPDSALTLATCIFLFGSSFHDPVRNPWMADVLAPRVTARQAVAMLKFRVALDHGRFV